MKKIALKVTLICTLIFALCVNAYAEETPEPVISNGSDVTITAKPGDSEIDIVTPTEDSGIGSNKISAENPNPPTDEESEIGTNKPIAENPNPPVDEDSEIGSNSPVAENPNPPTDIYSNSDGSGTTIAPQTGDASNVGMLGVAVLLSCVYIASCCRKRINN